MPESFVVAEEEPETLDSVAIEEVEVAEVVGDAAETVAGGVAADGVVLDGVAAGETYAAPVHPLPIHGGTTVQPEIHTAGYPAYSVASQSYQQTAQPSQPYLQAQQTQPLAQPYVQGAPYAAPTQTYVPNAAPNSHGQIAQPGSPYAQPAQPVQPYAMPYPTQYPATQAPTSRYEPFSIAALIAGLAGFTLLPVLGSLLGIVFGILGLHHSRQFGGASRGMAIAGIVLGAAALLLVPLALLVLFRGALSHSPMWW